ncbi:mobilisation protein (MobC) [Pricia antarctica]|uniref:Mobilisation protein (MobC) n=1 Tax=Pricia antarctica TaxID=641691 RepID=A0A1G7AB42_9FLAO|nr:plasmid mobilization relaxosome protein MobC [Pricia antarctica]SDE12019.1 mobilisation protein (MobC) [Pricia antarctica]
MKERTRGRKRLGDRKRYHNVMLRFNEAEYEKLGNICKSYHLDITKRGTISPLLRRLVLQQETEEKDRLPDTSNVSYQFNKIGNNINQLVKLAHHKSIRSPNSNLQHEIRKTNELLNALLEIVNEEK